MRILILLLVLMTQMLSRSYCADANEAMINSCSDKLSEGSSLWIAFIKKQLQEIKEKAPEKLHEVTEAINKLNPGLNLLSEAFKITVRVLEAKKVEVEGGLDHIKQQRSAELLSLFDKLLDKAYKQGAEIPATVKAIFEAEIGKLPIESIEAGAWAKMLAVGPNPGGSAVGKKYPDMTIAERASCAETNTGKLGVVIEKIKQNLPMPK